MEIDSTWDFTPHTWRRPWRRSWRERTRAGRGRRRRHTCWTTRLSPGRKHYSIINTGQGQQGEYLYCHSLSDNMRQFLWMGMTQHIHTLKSGRVQCWPSLWFSPQFQNNKKLHTRRSIVPSPLFSRHKACSATRTENNYFFRRDVSFYPPRLGQDWDGRLQTKDHVHLVWLQQNIQAETQYPLQPPASKRGRSVCKNHFQFSQHEI